MNDMPMMFPATAALMTAVMMAAMMLPSLAPTLWCYHRDLRAVRTSRAGERTVLFAGGYASVWTVVGLLLFAMSAAASPLESLSLASGAIVLAAGALQRSAWKARQLSRCRHPRVRAPVPAPVTTAWREGCLLGVDCAVSCAAPMAVLLVAGLMNTHMMVIVTAAITAERVMPAGARVARLTGAIALVGGVVMCMGVL